MELKPQLVKKFLPFVQKPTRYLGHEFGRFASSPDSDSHIALCYTGSYESGMQNAMFEFLYHFLNNQTAGSADRCFAPGPNAIKQLVTEQIPLFSNDSFLPLGSYKMLAFQVDDALCLPAVPTMLHLAGIPLKSVDRKADSPLIIGYGSAMSNPEPIAPFCDAIITGPAYKALHSLNAEFASSRATGTERETLLDTLAGNGFYIPANHQASYSSFGDFEALKQTYSSRMKRGDAPLTVPERDISFKPLMSIGEQTREHFSESLPYPHIQSEAMLRSRLLTSDRSGLTALLHTAGQKQLDRLGYEGLYPLLCETPETSALLWMLIKEIAFEQDKPLRLITGNDFALRTSDVDLASLSGKLKSHPFTVSVQSAAPRLRQMLNINLRDHELIKLVQYLAESGWTHIQLLFTIGLPTERDEDCAAIVSIVSQCLNKLQSFEDVSLSVRLDIFTPMPHSSLQWEQMESESVLKRRISALKFPESVQVIRPDVTASHQRGILQRGDRRLAAVLENIILSGNLPSPHSKVDMNVWQSSAEKANVELSRYLQSRSLIDPLAWDHLDNGRKSALKEDKLLAAANKLNDRNRDQVSLGASISRERFQELLSEQYRQSMLSDVQAKEAAKPKISYGRRGKRRQSSQAIIKSRLRVRYSKSGFMRFLSHSDIIRVFELATRSAKIPLVYSQSIRPTPKISYGSPLMTGIASVAEYLDMEIHMGREANIQNHLNSFLPEGLEILQFKGIFAKVTALAASINRSTYDVLLSENTIKQEWIDEWMAKENIPITRTHKDGSRELNVRPFVSLMEKKEDRLSITIDAHEGRMVKITEVLESLLAPKDLDFRTFFIQRTGQFVIKENSQYTPLEILP